MDLEKDYLESNYGLKKSGAVSFLIYDKVRNEAIHPEMMKRGLGKALNVSNIMVDSLYNEWLQKEQNRCLS